LPLTVQFADWQQGTRMTSNTWCFTTATQK
jgi:hypothetical protein